MEQVGGRVVAANVGPSRAVDLKAHEVALVYLAGDDFADVDDQSRCRRRVSRMVMSVAPVAVMRPVSLTSPPAST